MSNAWDLCLGLLALFSCITFLVDPSIFLHYSSLGLALGHTVVVYAWNLLYGAGGLAMLTGVLALRPDIEIAGLLCFAGASVIQIVAIAVVGPPLLWLGIFTYSVFAFAALVRALALLHTAGTK